MLTTIPFSGFYESIHSYAIDDALEQTCQDDRGEVISQNLLDKLNDEVNFKKAFEYYAKEYSEALANEFKIPLTFESLQSPAYYNFETDRIFCTIEEKDVRALFDRIDKKTLEKYLNDHFTSYDGFRSFYSNDLSDWLRTPLSEWDHNQLGALTACIAIQESRNNFDTDDEWNLLDPPSETASRAIDYAVSAKGEKLLKLAYYLRNRKELIADSRFYNESEPVRLRIASQIKRKIFNKQDAKSAYALFCWKFTNSEYFKKNLAHTSRQNYKKPLPAYALKYF